MPTPPLNLAAKSASVRPTAVTVQNNTDFTTTIDTVCDREIVAFAVDTAIAPHYCEVDAAEVPGLYGCTP